MSDLIIKGMKMPVSCERCPMLDWDLDYIKCKVTGRHFKMTECWRSIRVPDCPLVPAADVRPVVRGEWIGYPECLKFTNAYADDHIVCSACEECFSILDNDCERFNYCPNCGADMREQS